MKLYAISALALLAGAWSSAGSAAAASMLACNGCTPQQEESKAKSVSYNGVVFTYNLANARLRKFETFLVPSDDRSAGTKAGTPGWVRTVEEYTPDPGARRIFELLLAVERERPGVTFGQSFVPVPIGNVGQTEGSIGVRNFDPREIAWTRNLGNNSEYDKFMGRLQDQLGDASALQRMSSLLEKVLAIQFEIKSVSVSVSMSGPSIGMAIEPGVTSTLVKICDPKFNCVVLKITNDKGTVVIQFVKVEDRDGTTLPSKDNPTARWGPGGRDAATDYANWLNHRGTTTEIIGGSASCSYVLGCTSIPDTTLLACKVHCR